MTKSTSESEDVSVCSDVIPTVSDPMVYVFVKKKFVVSVKNVSTLSVKCRLLGIPTQT
jgi:hypothetical protein